MFAGVTRMKFRRGFSLVELMLLVLLLMVGALGVGIAILVMALSRKRTGSRPDADRTLGLEDLP